MGFAAARPSGSMASRKGSDIVAPSPRRTVRRGSDLVRNAMSIFSLIRPHQKSGALDDPKNERRPTVFMRRRVVDDFAHRRLVVVFESSPNRVGQELFSHGTRELLGALEQQRP